MKNNLIIFLFIWITIPLLSCSNEPVPPATEKEIISEIARNWSCHVVGDGFPFDNEATITSNPASDSQIFIYNFHNMGSTDKITATVKTDLSIIIPEQTVNNQTFSGTGDISNDYTQITFEYTLENDTETLQISATFTYGITS
jgi:hypothetical protein